MAVQVATSIEAQLAAARESVSALVALREEREKKAEAYRDKARQLMALRWASIGGVVCAKSNCSFIIIHMHIQAVDESALTAVTVSTCNTSCTHW